MHETGNLPYWSVSYWSASWVAFAEQWLTNTIIRHKHHATEFHVPSTKVCCKSSQTVAETLYNMNSFLKNKKNWSIKPPTSCNCHQFLQQHPECRTTAHHVASPLSAFNLPHQLAKCLAYSANSQIYFGYQKYTKITTELVQKWLNHHNLQNVDISKWQQFIDYEWSLHVSASKNCVRVPFVAGHTEGPSAKLHPLVVDGWSRHSKLKQRDDDAKFRSQVDTKNKMVEKQRRSERPSENSQSNQSIMRMKNSDSSDLKSLICQPCRPDKQLPFWPEYPVGTRISPGAAIQQ